jgi:hypothetical protein
LRSKALNKKRLENGTHHFAGEQGSKTNSERQKKKVDAGIHHWQSQDHIEKTRSINLERVKNGTHPFAGESGSQSNRFRHSELSVFRQKIIKLQEQCVKNGVDPIKTGRGLRSLEFLQNVIDQMEAKLQQLSNNVQSENESLRDSDDFAMHVIEYSVGDSAQFSANL